MGVAGRQVWQGGWDEANIPTLAAGGRPSSLLCPSLRVEVDQRAKAGRPTLAPVSPHQLGQVCVEQQRRAKDTGLLPNAWISGP